MRQNIWMKITAYLMLLLLIISFGVWGIADYLGYIGSQSPWIAQVNNVEISQDEVIQKYNQTLQNLQIQTLSEEQARNSNIFQLVIDNIVNEILIQQKSEDLGVSVDVETVKQQIMREPNFINPENKLFDPILFNSYLRNIGISENSFVRDLSKYIKISLVERILKQNAPPSISKKLYNWNFETRKVNFAHLPLADKNSIDNPSESELIEYYNQNNQEFTTQKHRSIKLIHISFTQAMQDVNVDEKELLNRYEQEKDRFYIPARAKVSRILFDSLQEAQEAYQNAKNQNLSLDQIASNTGKKINHLGFVEEGQSLNNLNQTIFSLQKNTISKPVELPLGFALISVSEKEEENIISFKDVRNLIDKEIREEKANDVMYSWYIDLEDNLAGGDDLSTVASNVGAELLSFENLTLSGYDAFSGESLSKIPPSAVQKAFEINIGEVSDVIKDGANGYFVVRADNEIQATVRKLQDVKPLVITAWSFDKRITKTLDDAIENSKHLKDRQVTKQDVSEIAKSYGVELQTSALFTRNGQRVNAQDNAPLPSLAMIDDVFNMEKGHILVDIDEKGPVLIWLSDIIAPENLSASSDEWNRVSSTTVMQALKDELRKDASISYNQNSIESLYDNLQ